MPMASKIGSACLGICGGAALPRGRSCVGKPEACPPAEARQVYRETVPPRAPPYDLSKVKFSEEDIPPRAPDSRSFGLAATTLEVTTTKPPFELGQHLALFLHEFLPKRTAPDDVFVELLKPVPSKPNKTKYSLKVLMFAQSNWCQTKIRIYKDPKASDEYFIEFQRRCGDTMAFNNVYRAAETYFQQQTNFKTEARGGKGIIGPPVAPLPPMPDMKDGDPPKPVQCALGPVLSLTKSNCLRYKAEGAGAIMELAGTLAWTAELGTVLKELLEVQDVIVAFPTVKALRSLAERHGEAAVVASDCKDKLSKLSETSILVRDEVQKLKPLWATEKGRCEDWKTVKTT